MIMQAKLEAKQHVVEFIEKIEDLFESLTDRRESVTDSYKLSILTNGIQTSTRGKDFESFFQTSRMNSMSYEQVKDGLISETFHFTEAKPKPSVAYVAERGQGQKCIHCRRSNHKSEDCFSLQNKGFK